MSYVVLAETAEKLPVGKIVAAGQNYADHTKEMGAPRPAEPVLFMKPSTSILHEGSPIVYPKVTELLHHEVELGLVIGDACKDISASEADRYILAYLLALDLTLRDLQSQAKEKGRPWATAKGFDGSCPISRATRLEDPSVLDELELGLKVNDEPRQLGNTRDMVWSSQELVAFASRFFTLERGDIVLTGTPAGVGPLVRGDRIEAWLGSTVAFWFDVV